jgi:hypothetical protein
MNLFSGAAGGVGTVGAATAGIAGSPLALAGMGTTLLGGLIGASGALAGGKYAEQMAQYKATQDTINASQAIASSQRQMLDTEQKTRLAISSLRARAGASGVNVASPSSVGAAGAIGARGAYQAGMALWSGQNQAAGLLTQAAAERATGQAAQIGAGYSSAATIAGMGSSMLSQYSSFLRNVTPTPPRSPWYYS